MVDVRTDGVKEGHVGRRSRLVSALILTVFAVVALAILLNRDSKVSSPVSVANAFMEARDNLDGQTAQALFASNVPISDGFIEGVDQYPVFFDWLRTSNWRWTIGECAEYSTGEGGTLVRCDYVSENDWTRALSHSPVSGVIEILVTDGEITGLVHTGEIAQFDAVWDIVTAWMEVNHPDTIDQMLTPDLERPTLDATSVALWEQYSEEFVASFGD
jgi:hypothetical protein